MTPGLFVTGTGTGVGKTHVTCALVRALRARGEHVHALKPIETGCADGPSDARAIAEAAGRPELADLPGLLRLMPPLAPAAIDAEKPTLTALAETIRASRPEGATLIVEGAGGLLVPYDDTTDLADLPLALGLPLLVVAPDRLGVLHDVRATVECAERRGLVVRAVLLSAVATPDASAATNAELLRQRLPCPVMRWPRLEAAETSAEIARSGLLEMLGFVSR